MKNNLRLIVIMLMSALCTAMQVRAQKADDEPELKISPISRALFDGAVYSSPDKSEFKSGVAIPEVRLGVKASYGKWQAKIDVGYAYNKVGLKDVYIQYNFDDENSLRGGSFIHQYGLQSTTSSSRKATFVAPVSNSVFNMSRQLGLSFVHNSDKLLATFSAHAEPQSIILTPNQLGKEGYGMSSRIVFRPRHDDGTILQVGISGGFATPIADGDRHDTFSFAGRFPTRVNRTTAIEVSMTDAMNQWKFTPELLLATGPVALEAQYFFNRVNFRHDLHSFTGQGAYVTVRGLLLGGRYGYAMYDGGISTPAKGSLELALDYNYTTLNDRKAEQFGEDGRVVTGLFGGAANSLSATLNYYINKYMCTRLNYTYMHTFNGAALATDFNVVQLRFQIIF